MKRALVVCVALLFCLLFLAAVAFAASKKGGPLNTPSAAWLLVAGLICAAVGFLASRWVQRKDAVDDSLQASVIALQVEVAGLAVLIRERPCIKAAATGGPANGCPSEPGPKDNPPSNSPGPLTSMKDQDPIQSP